MPPSSDNPLAGALGEELQALAATGLARSFKAGDFIFTAGDPGDGFYLVESGRVLISATVGDNEPRVLATIGPGDFFGEMAVLDDAPRSANAQAESDTQARFLSREELLQLLDRRPRLALNLIREFSRRMRAVNQKFVNEIVHATRLTAVGQFAGTIVHDFKNPLTVISLAAELACHQATSHASRQKARQRIMRQVDSMTAMLDELIEYTRPTGRRIALARLDLASYILPLVDEINGEVTDRGFKVEAIDVPANLDVRIEPPRISRLFRNLINNSLDEMPNGGKITLSFAVTKGDLQVNVEDTGNGIAPEIATQLFQPFATHGKAHGTGLGLSICKKIVEDHGGRIWAHSEPGRGAVFSFTLPLTAEAPKG